MDTKKKQPSPVKSTVQPKTDKIEFIPVDKLKVFVPNGTQFEFSPLVNLYADKGKEPVKGQVYRYALSPQQIYFVSETGQGLADIKFYSTIKQ